MWRDSNVGTTGSKRCSFSEQGDALRCAPSTEPHSSILRNDRSSPENESVVLVFFFLFLNVLVLKIIRNKSDSHMLYGWLCKGGVTLAVHNVPGIVRSRIYDCQFF